MNPFSIELLFNDENIIVIGHSWKAHRGMRERGTGLQLEPDEEAGFEIDEVIYKDVDVTGIIDMELVEEKLNKYWEDQREE